MPSAPKTLDEDLQQFPYVNGDLFRENLRLPSFNAEMRDRLLDCVPVRLVGNLARHFRHRCSSPSWTATSVASRARTTRTRRTS